MPSRPVELTSRDFHVRSAVLRTATSVASGVFDGNGFKQSMPASPVAVSAHSLETTTTNPPTNALALSPKNPSSNGAGNAGISSKVSPSGEYSHTAPWLSDDA